MRSIDVPRIDRWVPCSSQLTVHALASDRIAYDTKAGLRLICYYGTGRFGIVQAEQHTDRLFERFGQIVENPYLYQPVDFI